MKSSAENCRERWPAVGSFIDSEWRRLKDIAKRANVSTQTLPVLLAWAHQYGLIEVKYITDGCYRRHPLYRKADL